MVIWTATQWTPQGPFLVPVYPHWVCQGALSISIYLSGKCSRPFGSSAQRGKYAFQKLFPVADLCRWCCKQETLFCLLIYPQEPRSVPEHRRSSMREWMTHATYEQIGCYYLKEGLKAIGAHLRKGGFPWALIYHFQLKLRGSCLFFPQKTQWNFGGGHRSRSRNFVHRHVYNCYIALQSFTLSSQGPSYALGTTSCPREFWG